MKTLFVQYTEDEGWMMWPSGGTFWMRVLERRTTGMSVQTYPPPPPRNVSADIMCALASIDFKARQRYDGVPKFTPDEVVLLPSVPNLHAFVPPAALVRMGVL